MSEAPPQSNDIIRADVDALLKRDVSAEERYQLGMRCKNTVRFEWARELFEAAAGLGHLDACYELANIYEHGIGCPESESTALLLYQRAAEAGHVKASARYGHALFFGLGVRHDGVGALRFIEAAVKGGDPEACFMLGNVYQSGLAGREKNNELAIEYYTRAGTADALGQVAWIQNRELCAAMDADLEEARRKDRNAWCVVM